MIALIVHIKRKIDNLILDFKFSRMAYSWRKLNRHNKTFAGNFFPIDRVKVGKYSYGLLNVRSFCDNAGEALEIGNYVSIAEKVIFVLGGEHQTETFATFPLRAYFSGIDNSRDSMSKGPIIVEDEVWIGFGAIILSGVRIGKGAIIGAGAVISKDIPSYGIAVGNPVKVIKYRVSNETIKKIKNLKLTDIPVSAIQKNFELFYEDIENNDYVIERIKKLCSFKINNL